MRFWKWRKIRCRLGWRSKVDIKSKYYSMSHDCTFATQLVSLWVGKLYPIIEQAKVDNNWEKKRIVIPSMYRVTAEEELNTQAIERERKKLLKD